MKNLIIITHKWWKYNLIISIFFHGIFLFSEESIVINEINYHSSDDFNPEDWVELYNPLNETIDIGNWVFLDEDDTHVFTIPENYSLNSGDFLVLCKNTELFTTVFPEVDNYLGDLGFGLSGGGEPIRLFDSNNELVDEVDYDDEGLWPIEPDGTGPTLELMDPFSDNALAENWGVSTGHGTPGSINSTALSMENSFLIPENLILYDNYPNPFNPKTSIIYSLPKNSFVIVTIYNSLGNHVKTLVSQFQIAGDKSIVWNAQNDLGQTVSSGVYIYSVKTDHFYQSKKMIFLK